MSDRALLAVLLNSTGLSQTEAARFVGVQDRALRRWLDGSRAVPADVIERLTALDAVLERGAREAIKDIDAAHGPVAMPVYRTDDDLPEWTELPTASSHLAMARRVYNCRRNKVALVMFNHDDYTAWLDGRPDKSQYRAAWAAWVAGDASLAGNDAL